VLEHLPLISPLSTPPSNGREGGREEKEERECGWGNACIQTRIHHTIVTIISTIDYIHGMGNMPTLSIENGQVYGANR
jgi:hypothetical protein